MELWNIVILCFLTFIAGFIDSIAGGGGLISLPAYLLTGLPAHLAAGSNKFSACLGTALAILRFGVKGKILWKEALFGMAAALAGAALGSLLALHLSELHLRAVIVGALPVVAVIVLLRGVLVKKNAVSPPIQSLRRRILISLAIGLGIGLYDGLVGPGTGTFLIIASVLFLHIDMLTASGNAKVINFASNIASLAVFALNGAIAYRYALPAAASTIIGSYLGVSYCMRFGPNGVRKVLFGVMGLLFLKLGYDCLKGFGYLG